MFATVLCVVLTHNIENCEAWRLKHEALEGFLCDNWYYIGMIFEGDMAIMFRAEHNQAFLKSEYTTRNMIARQVLSPKTNYVFSF